MVLSRSIDPTADDRPAADSASVAATALTKPRPKLRPKNLPRVRQQQLLAIARAAIAYRLDPTSPPPDPLAFPARWNSPVGCFVTLSQPPKRTLRGCVGTLEPDRPLAEAVVYFAQQAAFNDSRFAPLQAAELSRTGIELSLLSPLRRLTVASENELLERLRPGIDGLLLQAGPHRATYLPQVWQQLPDPQAFVASLKRKAGLAAHSWHADVGWSIYQVQHYRESGQ